jgi:two-component system, LytTR family, response regulator
MYVHLLPSRPPAGDDDVVPGAPDRRAWLARIPVRSMNRIVIVPVAAVVRLEAEDNYVRIWADRPYLHKETLTGLMRRLDPAEFLRVHRSHAVNLRLVRELRPQLHGEFVIALADGTEITSGRSYRCRIQQAFGLGRADGDDAPNTE